MEFGEKLDANVFPRAGEIGQEFDRSVVQGAAEIGSALFTGNSYVPYGQGQNRDRRCMAWRGFTAKGRRKSSTRMKGVRCSCGVSSSVPFFRWRMSRAYVTSGFHGRIYVLLDRRGRTNHVHLQEGRRKQQRSRVGTQRGGDEKSTRPYRQTLEVAWGCGCACVRCGCGDRPIADGQ